jgi:hypothetical protein
MKIFLNALIVTAVLVGDVAYGQTPPAPPAKPSPPSPAPARPTITLKEPPPAPRHLINIRVDVVVTEEGGDAPVSRKDVSLTVGESRQGSVRSGGGVGSGEGKFDLPARLWVDAQPRLESNGKIRTMITMSYLSPPHFAREGEQKLEVLLDNGKPLVVSQTSSATSERRMKVELTATILK